MRCWWVDKLQNLIDILKLISSGQLSEVIENQSEVSVYHIKELYDAGLIDAIDSSNMALLGYENLRLTFKGRAYISEYEESENMNDNIKIFISHCSKDKIFVESLIELLRNALNLMPISIRCTSVEPYTLNAGDETDDVLKREVHGSEVFIGIVSSESISSMYCMFEFGARWGSGKAFIPLVVPGTDASLIGKPLSNITYKLADSKPALRKVLDQISSELNVELNSETIYEKYFNSIIEHVSTVS